MKSFLHQVFRLVIILIILLTDGCTKVIDTEISPVVDENGIGDDPDPDFQDYLADSPNVDFSLDDILLSDGSTIKEFLAAYPEFSDDYQNALKGGRLSATLDDADIGKRVLFAQALLFTQAERLTNITKYPDLWDVKNGTMKGDEFGGSTENISEVEAGRRKKEYPQQPLGLGYSYGQRDWKVRAKAPHGTCKDFSIYGLDCSGFIINIFRMAGFTISDGVTVADMYGEKYWTKVLESNPKLSEIKVSFVPNTERLTKFQASKWNLKDFKSGDIVFWEGVGEDDTKKWNHMGIVFDTKLGKRIFQANGISKPDLTEKGTMINCGQLLKGNCLSNYLCPGRGVRAKDLSFLTLYKGSTTMISVLRLQAYVGSEGNPRFNLTFDNEDNVDLDLHVMTPAGQEIYYRNKFDYATLGELDVDCYCEDCPNKGNENIYWPVDKPSPKGKYKFWIEYFKACQGGNPSSKYTIVVRDDVKKETLFNLQGSMSPNSDIPVWEYDSETRKIFKVQ